MNVSFNNRINGYNDLGRGKLNGFIGGSIARGSENNESDNDACSVGSCSAISKSPNKCSTSLLALSCQETDSISSDGESFCGSGRGELFHSSRRGSNSKNTYVRVACLSLHSGGIICFWPLKLGKEALLTNLRISLHISNDEHLMELKNLISAGTGNGKSWRHVILASKCVMMMLGPALICQHVQLP